MNYLETILSFFLNLARVVIGRKRKKEPEKCSGHLPDGHDDTLTSHGTDGSNAGRNRDSALALQSETHPVTPLNILGWCLILASLF